LSDPLSVLVVRGDLCSTSGYARATGLYLSQIEDEYGAVLGVDLHAHWARPTTSWEYPLVDDAAIAQLAQRDDTTIDVLTIATPDHFRPFPVRRNIGCFFWETDRLGNAAWIAMINHCVSEVWVPAAFMGTMLVREGVFKPIVWRPCPLPVPLEIERSGNLAVVLQEVGFDAAAQPVLTTLQRLRESADPLFLSTNTFIPRKGLPVLVHEWQSVLDICPEAALILKVAAIDVTMSRADLQEAVETVIRDVWEGRSRTNIYLLMGSLGADDMAVLTRTVDAQLTTSFGEGFGLGVFESLAAGRPAICPRHTSLAELLPVDYRYFIDTAWENVGLADPAGVYPISARWGVPCEGSLRHVVRLMIDDRRDGNLDHHVTRAVSHARSPHYDGASTWNA
jgi:glycosyltransferase involved in cell wall biosynthesis